MAPQTPAPLQQAAAQERSGGWPAWLLSLLLHVGLLVLLGLGIRVMPQGAQVEPDRGAGIVLVRRAQGPVQYLSEGQTESTSTTETHSQPVALPTAQESPVAVQSELPASVDVAAPGWKGSGLPAAESMIGGRPPAAKAGGNKVQTEVFGLSGIGTRFVYVFDRSASMDGFGGRPLAAAKSQLIRSLGDLGKVHQFQIIFYNDRSSPLNPSHPNPPKMLFGSDQNKRIATRFVENTTAAGSTKHMQALRLALAMRPDVIFFLTDAAEPQLTATELDEIRRRNQSVGASINAIEFGSGPSGDGVNFLVRLARDNSGQHAYVDINRLLPKP